MVEVLSTFTWHVTFSKRLFIGQLKLPFFLGRDTDATSLVVWRPVSDFEVFRMLSVDTTQLQITLRS